MKIGNFRNQPNRFIPMAAFALLLYGCMREKDSFVDKFGSFVSSNGISYWDYWPYEYLYGVKAGPIQTYGFKRDGTLEIYDMLYRGDDTIGRRWFIKLDTLPRPPSYKTNKWRVTEDSILHLMYVDGYKIVRYSQDSISMKLVLYHGSPHEDTIERFRILHRVKEADLRLDEESRMLKDSLDRLSK